MKYKGFFVKITPDNYLPRETENGEVVAGEGFRIEVFADESEEVEIDILKLSITLDTLTARILKLSSNSQSRIEPTPFYSWWASQNILCKSKIIQSNKGL